MTDSLLPKPPGHTFDPSTPAPARTHAVLHGAKRDGFAADREAAKVPQQNLTHSAKVLDAINWHLGTDTPVVVLMGAVLHFLTDEQGTNLRFALRSRLKSHSKIVVTHVTGDGLDADVVKKGQARYEELHGIPMYVRTEHEVMGLVRDFHVPDPGVVRTVDFLPEPGVRIPLEVLPHFYAVMAEAKA
ncbi:SAM-dependent methyltransferase [Nonomuraea sp. NPDC050404]|uniref:SAM-dependent methyltransferase n=1 Tax=Nonomuraea sp. NPDC050404 TaxID=3155783 RepID=UPI0033EDAA88